MNDFRCNGCFRALNIGHESSVSAIDTRNPSYLTSCDHLFCYLCREKYRSICPRCRHEVRWIDTSRVKEKERFHPLDVSTRRMQKIHQFQSMQMIIVDRRLMDMNQAKMQCTRDRNKKVVVLKQRYQYLKNMYSHRLTLYRKIKKIEM